MMQLLKYFFYTFFALVIFVQPSYASAKDLPNSVLILDASRSMWGQIDKVSKILMARNALTDNFLRYNGRYNLGIMAYGHKKSDACNDIGQIQPIQRLDGPLFAASLSNIKPKGSTPIGTALKQAAQQLLPRRSPKSIILVSDGLDNCESDPCQISQTLKQQDRELRIHVIAFDRKLKNKLTALQCIARNTNGIFLSATNEAELKLALRSTFDAAFLLTSSNPVETPQAAASQSAGDPQNLLSPLSDLTTQSTPETADPQTQNKAQALDVPKGLVPVTFIALIKEGGLPIKSNIVWRIFDARPNKKGKYKLLSTHRKPKPTAALTPGSYLVNAAYGRSHLTKKVIVKENQPLNELFVLNAGGLRLGSVSANGKPVAKDTVNYAIFSDERDQFGNRQKIISNARPGLIIRLNAGLYHIVSQYGDANAKVSADVTIEPGKLTEATINHTAAKVTFKLVMRPGGEALADTRWSILTPQGEVVKDSAGALPTHILAAGNYTIMARRAGQIFKREFKVKPGEAREIEVVVQ